MPIKFDLRKYLHSYGNAESWVASALLNSLIHPIDENLLSAHEFEITFKLNEVELDFVKFTRYLHNNFESTVLNVIPEHKKVAIERLKDAVSAIILNIEERLNESTRDIIDNINNMEI